MEAWIDEALKQSRQRILAALPRDELMAAMYLAMKERTPPPPRQKAKAGRRSTALLILLILALLGCGIADGVRKFAEPVDTAGCRFDCGRAGMGFSNYVYVSNSCWCLGDDGHEVKLYGYGIDIDLEE